MLQKTLCTWCYMQLVQCVLANLWYGASCPSLGAPRTTYVSKAALCTLCGVRYVHSTLVCSAVAVLLFAPHVACAQRLDSLHKPHAVVCACLTLAHEHHTLRRCPANGACCTQKAAEGARRCPAARAGRWRRLRRHRLHALQACRGRGPGGRRSWGGRRGRCVVQSCAAERYREGR